MVASQLVAGSLYFITIMCNLVVKPEQELSKMKHILWILISALLLATGSVFAGDADLLIRRANRFF